DSMLLWGAVGTAAFLLIYAVVLYFLNASFLKKGVYHLPEKEAAVYSHNHRLKRICAIVLLAVLTVTFVGHHFATSIWGPYSIMKGTTFEDYDSFIAYMEQDVPAELRDSADLNGANETAPLPAEPIDPAVYFDEFGNEISEEEALTRRLKDKNGNVVCEYIERREGYVSLRYVPQDGTILPITVCTQSDLEQARQTANLRHMIFGAAYCVEVFAAVLVYFIKRTR
ncbi:MAG: hypothetical protein IJC67_03560, partial [Clostridia bacterium]|nr:hypothetical protein [Clostridia bacterium]